MMFTMLEWLQFQRERGHGQDSDQLIEFAFRQSGVYYLYGHWLDFISVAPSLNPLPCLKKPTGCFLPVGVFNPVMFFMVYLFLII